MSKDATDLQDLPLTQETPAMQTSMDLFNAYLSAPVPKKLHADEYTANDIDGGTEGLLGSGNMNFLMMQAGQTNESIATSNPFDIASSDAAFTPTGISSSNAAAPLPDSGARGDISMDRAFEMPRDLGAAADVSPAGFTNTAGSLGASTLAANNASANIFSDHSGFTGSLSSVSSSTPPLSPTNGISGTSGVNGLSGTNGVNGTNGTNATGGGDTTTIINNYDYSVVNLGDTITNIDETLLETVENIYNNTTDFLTTVVNNVTDIVNNILNGTPLDLGPIGLNLGVTLDDITNLTLDLINGNNILSVLNENLNLSPVLDPITSLTGDLFADLNLGILIDPFQYDGSANDHDLQITTDLNLLGLDLPHINIPLDAVEFLLGDIDINLNLTEDLLNLDLLGGGNADTDLGILGLDGIAGISPVLNVVENLVEGVFNPVENLIGDVDILGDLHSGLLGLGQDGTGPDTDITIPLDLNIINSNLLNNGLEISIDPIENLLGDIDLDLTVAGNLLGDIADGLIDNESGGDGMGGILADTGDLAAGLVGGLLYMDGQVGDTDILVNAGLGIPGTELLNDGAEILLDPVENILGDIDVAAGVGLDLFNAGDSQSATDTDLNIGVDLGDVGLPAIDLPVNLDLVEAITGDIDLDLDVSTEVVETAIDTLTGLLDGGSLFEGGIVENTPIIGDLLNGETPITDAGDMVIDFIDNLAPGLDDVTGLLSDVLDGVEETLGAAVNLLDSLPINTGGLDLDALNPGNGGGDILGDALGGLGSLIPSWTEAALPDVGGLLGGGLPCGGADLPDPVSIALVLPLPIIPVLPVLPSHGGGGLFGGLFG